MEITFKTRHCELPETLKEQTEARLHKLERFSGKIVEAHVIVGVEKYRHIAEVTLSGNGSEIVSKCESDEMGQALKKVMDVIERRVRERKEKLVSRKGKRGANLKSLPLLE
ncbi:MAG: ribosome-associated translation inhibitor RaiA [Candidatus Eisenbacteria bacterium]|nr:ribosome-associated translation inhibitor RaiA [Candidatus Eisenbacteria bacterium]